MRCWCWPGNTNDQAILPEVRDGLRGWRLGRVVTVVDRGFSSRENLAYLQRAGGHYIAGERMRDGTPARRRGAVPPGPLPAGPRQPAGQGSPDRLHTRASGGSSATTPMKPNATRPQRDAAVARITAELDRIAAARTRAREQARTRRADHHERGRAAARRAAAERDEAAHVKAECALREHPALGRWLRQTPSGRLQSGPGQDHRRSEAGREVPAVHLGPGPVRRGRRAGLQEPAGSRTRVPRPEVHHRAAPGVPPARTPHPRPRAALLARAAADPGRRTPHRHDLAHRSTASWAGCTRSPSPGRPGRSSRPPNPPPPSRAFFGPADSPRHPGSPPSTPPEQQQTPSARPPAERGHTPASSPHARSPRSTPRFSPHVCPRTAEPGGPAAGFAADAGDHISAHDVRVAYR